MLRLFHSSQGRDEEAERVRGHCCVAIQIRPRVVHPMGRGKQHAKHTPPLLQSLNVSFARGRVGSMSRTTICPGCGLTLPSAEERLDERYHASAACRQVYDELTAYTLSLRDETFPHQFAVDAYAAQHAGKNVKPIAITFALVGLYLACERDYPGIKVQKAHMLLARTARQWPQWRRPEAQASRTVLDVLNAPEWERIGMLREWSRSVWRMWEAEQAKVAAFVQERLHI